MNLFLCLECKGSVVAENGKFFQLTVRVVLLSKHLCYAGTHSQYWIGSRSFQHFLVAFYWFFFCSNPQNIFDYFALSFWNNFCNLNHDIKTRACLPCDH